MNKRPGHVKVTTEAGYCNFCGRPRNLRHEEHQLGNFVRTVVTCETCHRTLSSTIGVATPDTPASEAVPASPGVDAVPASPEVEADVKPQPAKRAPKKVEAASTKAKAAKSRSTKTK